MTFPELSYWNGSVSGESLRVWAKALAKENKKAQFLTSQAMSLDLADIEQVYEKMAKVEKKLYLMERLS